MLPLISQESLLPVAQGRFFREGRRGNPTLKKESCCQINGPASEKFSIVAYSLKLTNNFMRGRKIIHYFAALLIGIVAIVWRSTRDCRISFDCECLLIHETRPGCTWWLEVPTYLSSIVLPRQNRTSIRFGRIECVIRRSIVIQTHYDSSANERLLLFKSFVLAATDLQPGSDEIVEGPCDSIRDS